MNDSYINYCSDDSFGPTVHLQSCRDGFDFTLLFEESIFAILPSVLLLCAVPVRLRSLYRRPDAVNWPLLRVIKLVSSERPLTSCCALMIGLDNRCCPMSPQTGAAGSMDAPSVRGSTDPSNDSVRSSGPGRRGSNRPSIPY